MADDTISPESQMADDTFYFTLSHKWQMTLSVSPESEMADDTFCFT